MNSFTASREEMSGFEETDKKGWMEELRNGLYVFIKVISCERNHSGYGQILQYNENIHPKKTYLINAIGLPATLEMVPKSQL